MSQKSSPFLFTLVILYAASIAGCAPSLSSRATNVTSQAVTNFAPLGSATDVFREGAACRASWIADTTGATTWKSMTIQLMTGSNMQMTALGTVASGIDGTNPSVTVFNYACPEVSPNAAIYFLQYTHDGGLDPTWTTRFAIADEDGKTVAPPQANQPQGGSPAIPWGQGTLVAVSNTAPTSSSSSSIPSSTSTKVMTTTRSSASATSTSDSFAQQKKNLANAFSSVLAGSDSSASSTTTYTSSASVTQMATSQILAPAILVVCLALLL